MALKVYNTLTNKKEEFIPQHDGRVGMYACGVTVYDFSHIGHARAMVVFDVVQRYLSYCGYAVTFVRNYTDVDDKIIRRANDEGVSFREISERFIREFDDDMRALGVENPTHTPRATDYIPDMVDMVAMLIDKDHAYEVDGDVYFDVASFDEYGKLSGKDTESLLAGARVDVDERKRSPLDFALWKKTKEGEPSWPSPWGPGRPGWHIECSAMSRRILGDTFDIHGGGMDLIFPHHENEIAQSECASGRDFARYWLHNGFVNINKEKMSKSLKNFLTIREVLQAYHPEVIRLFLLSHHYRSPVDFSEQNLLEARAGLDRFYTLLKSLQELKQRGSDAPLETDGSARNALREIKSFPAKLRESMDDDFNTAAALGHLHSLTRTVNGLVDRCTKDPGYRIPALVVEKALDAFFECKRVLGLFAEAPDAYFERQAQDGLSASGLTRNEIEDLVAERLEAKKDKDWPRADAIRDSLAEKGIMLKDTPQGTEWSVKGT